MKWLILSDLLHKKIPDQLKPKMFYSICYKKEMNGAGINGFPGSYPYIKGPSHTRRSSLERKNLEYGVKQQSRTDEHDVFFSIVLSILHNLTAVKNACCTYLKITS